MNSAKQGLLAASLIALAALTAGACTRTERLCAAVCDCEHCNDLAEDILCAGLDARAELADVYDCTSEFEASVDCTLDEGTCNDTKARYSTREPGSCSGEQNTQQPCASVADCGGLLHAYCNGTCRYKVCAGGSGYPCENDDDCPSGADRCEAEETALEECIDNASAK
ncbi:MAG: hypothetical protein HY908_21580 [Myxococcales bacterium]|nr:hypothetical protein [Myxococcales bacterium]